MEQMNNEQTIYNAALYCRLSKDDEQAGESVSIGTQRMILEKFCKEHDFHVFDVYVDDGFSGLNFERPEFQRMLKDIEDGKIKGKWVKVSELTHKEKLLGMWNH